VQHWWWHFCGGNTAHPVALKALLHRRHFNPAWRGKKQSTCALVAVQLVAMPCVQRHCQPTPYHIAMPFSLCGLLSPPPQKKEKKINQYQYPFCDPAASPLMQHFSKNIYNQPAALVPVCGGCVFGATQCWWDASGGVARRTIAAFGGFCVACGGFLTPHGKKKRNIQPALLVAVAVLLWCVVMQQVPHAA